MIANFDQLLQSAFASCDYSEPIKERIRTHLLGNIVAFGRHTLTGVLTTAGATQQDWSADYRLYSRLRLKPQILLDSVCDLALQELAPSAPVVVALDDTCIKKSGRRIPGTQWMRDPLSPKFNVNLVWSQRYIQMSIALPASDNSARLIPIGFTHAPRPAKPKKNASTELVQNYLNLSKQANLNRVANLQLVALRDRLTPTRALHAVVDGSYTNKTFLRSLPANTVCIGRVRRDSVFYFPPVDQLPNGRPRFYGNRAPTPDQLYRDDQHPWTQIRAHSAGNDYDFKVKVLSGLRSELRGCDDVQLVVIQAVRYQLSKSLGSAPRQPCFLICTDNTLSIEQLLQEYLWRWDIEVNFRDEKTLLGVGQAQVRNPNSVDSLPKAAVAAYSMLLLASVKTFGITGQPDQIPRPFWRNNKPSPRASTTSLINQTRFELWSKALRPDHLTGFVSRMPSGTKPLKPDFNLACSLFSSSP